MRTSFRFLCIVCAVVILCASCSGGKGGREDGNPLVPQITADVAENPGIRQGRAFIGYWRVRINEDLTYEVIPDRAAEMHLNCVHLIEDNCYDCLKLTEIHLLPEKQVAALMVLRHPFPGVLNYTGFDVRGIFISGAGYEFPESERSIAWGSDVPRMLKYDGFTELFNPTDYPETYPLALGYIPGHMATGGNLTATLNPYIRFQTKAQRSIFMPGEMAYSYMQVYAHEHPIEFGYAVDACWQLVSDPVTDPVSQFPDDANALEAYKVDVQVGTGIEAGGGSAEISAMVYDHQGQETIGTVTAEAPELFDGEVLLTYAGEGGGGFKYTGTIENTKHAEHGEFPVLVHVRELNDDQNLGPVDAWQVYIVYIKKGWVRTWGVSQDDVAYSVATGPSDELIVTGSQNGNAGFLRSFNTAGELQWGRGLQTGVGFDVTVDSNGRIFVTGFSLAGDGLIYIFLSVYDSSGQFIDTVKFGGTLTNVGYAIALDKNSNIYISGFFQGTVDFNPGPGEDIHTSNGSTDVYLVKFDSNGAFQWARTWGGIGMDCGQSIAIDSMDRIYVT
jgi:hypothetical protein